MIFLGGAYVGFNGISLFCEIAKMYSASINAYFGVPFTPPSGNSFMTRCVVLGSRGITYILKLGSRTQVGPTIIQRLVSIFVLANMGIVRSEAQNETSHLKQLSSAVFSKAVNCVKLSVRSTSPCLPLKCGYALIVGVIYNCALALCKRDKPIFVHGSLYMNRWLHA